MIKLIMLKYITTCMLILNVILYFFLNILLLDFYFILLGTVYDGSVNGPVIPVTVGGGGGFVAHYIGGSSELKENDVNTLNYFLCQFDPLHVR